MDVSSPVTRAAVAAGVLAVVTALGTVLAVVAAGAGPAVPLAVLLAVVLLVCRRQLRAFLTRPQGLWYRLLLAGIGLFAAACAPQGPPEPPPVAAPDPGGTPARVARALAALPRGWSELPAPPSAPAPGAVSVWTGAGLFVWGGEDGHGRSARGRGWLFDPVSRRWRAASATAFPGRGRAATAWTGEEVLVWGGDVEGAAFGDGVAYDPALDAWRGLPPAPISARTPVASAWTGRELLIVGSRLDGANHARTPGAVGLAYDPAGDRWRRLPGAGLSPQASTVAWTGRELVAWDYELRAAAYSPDQDRWRRLPDLALDDAECYPQGAASGWFVFAQLCASHALWDQRTRRWARVGQGQDLWGTVVAAGPVFLFAGAVAGRDGPGPGRLLAYNPA